MLRVDGALTNSCMYSMRDSFLEISAQPNYTISPCSFSIKTYVELIILLEDKKILIENSPRPPILNYYAQRVAPEKQALFEESIPF